MLYRKVVVTKGIIEVTQYQYLNVRGNGGEHDGDGENSEHNYKQRMQKRRDAIRHLICCNFDSGDKFFTLTYSDSKVNGQFDIRDVKACNKKFKDFVLRIKRRYPGFKYVAVIEFQDTNGRGAVHYHVVCNLPYVLKSELSELWGWGFVYINRIDHCDNIGAYVIKYMVADMDDRRLQGLHAYLRSRGLETPLELKSWHTEDCDDLNKIMRQIERKSPTYGGEPYMSEYCGYVLYSQYNLNRGQNQDVRGIETNEKPQDDTERHNERRRKNRKVS